MRKVYLLCLLLAFLSCQEDDEFNKISEHSEKTLQNIHSKNNHNALTIESTEIIMKDTIKSKDIKDWNH